MFDPIYPPIVLTAKTMFRVLGQRFQMDGVENIPRKGGVLIAVNHIGYVDFIYGGLPADKVGRRIRFMAKRELFDHPVTGPIMRGCKHIEVDRAAGTRSAEIAVEYLKKGEAVGIFPEATISRAMEIKELKTGAVRIAAEAEVPLVPVVLWGTQRIMTKDQPRDLTRGRTVTIKVGEPLHPTASDDAAAVTEELRTVMSQMLDEAIADHPADEQPPGSWWVPARHGGSAPTLERAAEMDAEEKAARAAKRAAKGE